MRQFRALMLTAILALGAGTGPLAAQTRALTGIPVPGPNVKDGRVVIDFEDIGSAASGAATPAPLTTQYRKAHGVAFGHGVSVHLCSGQYDEFARSLCVYPRAASGVRAGVYEPRAGGADWMSVTFDRPVSAVSLRINPTGGQEGARFRAEAVGFDAAGKRVAGAELRFQYGEDMFAWPNTLGFKSETPVHALRVVLRLDRTGLPGGVRFFFDDLAFRFAPDGPPVAAAVAALDAPPKSGRGTIMRGGDAEKRARGLRLYPAPARKRLDIDWPAAEADAEDQRALGLEAAAPTAASRGFVDRAELPLLLPARAERDTLQVFGNRDVVNAVWREGGRDYAVYGSRIVTVLRKADGAPGVRSGFTVSGSSDDRTASFSLYGASYAVTQFCNGGEDADPLCQDEDHLRKVAEDLLVVIGDRGRARP